MLLLNEHVQFPYRASNPSLHIIADGRATITPLRGLYSVFPLLFIKNCVFSAMPFPHGKPYTSWEAGSSSWRTSPSPSR